MFSQCFQYSQDIINDLETLLEDNKGYDVIIYAGKNEEEIHAHSNILCLRSQYFRTALSNEFVEKKDGKFVLRKPNTPPQIFKVALRFIYCGKIDLEKLQGSDVLRLLIAVNELNLQTLIHDIKRHFTKHQDKFLQQNPIGILEIGCQDENFSEFILEKICEGPEVLFNSDEFISLKTSLLELLLKRNDLSFNEITIWDNLIKWCLAQHSNISQDVTQWNKEEITAMERTIHRFIPLIRFHHISSEDFISKVYPFKKVLSKDLSIHMDPNKQSTQPPRKPKCDSFLIKSQFFATLATWIERDSCESHYYTECMPYKFNLLYRASRDGNTAAAFHQKCDNKGATVVIAKIANSEEIVGGYNPLFWDKGEVNHSTIESFIFSIKSRNNIKGIVGYGNIHNSIGCYKNYGPLFGGSYDLCWGSNSTWHSDAGLTSILKGCFNVEDYEVFQVTKSESFCTLVY